MIKTITLGGLTSVTIKQSPYDMARFCWMYNHSDSDVFASCVNSDCTENADGVLRVPAGKTRMLDTESYETLYLNGSGTVEIITSAFAVCPFSRGGKGGVSYELPIATTEILGGVMPDGTTINVDENGVISAVGSGETNYTIQYGVATHSKAGMTVQFPNPFKTTPIVVVSTNNTTSVNRPTIAYLEKNRVSTVSFSAYIREYGINDFSSDTASIDAKLYWIAIGEV